MEDFDGHVRSRYNVVKCFVSTIDKVEFLQNCCKTYEYVSVCHGIKRAKGTKVVETITSRRTFGVQSGRIEFGTRMYGRKYVDSDGSVGKTKDGLDGLREEIMTR